MAVAAAILGAAAIGGGATLAGGKKGANAATQSASIQAAAAMQAAQLQQQRFQQVAQTLQPFIGFGQQAMGPLAAMTGTAPGTSPLTAPLTRLPAQWSPTMAQLSQMPGYQFQLQTGLNATQQNLAQAGLGRSGSAAAGAAQFASGLAASNWQSNFAQFLQQQNLNLAGQGQAFNMLSGQLGTGLQAAGALGGVGIQSAANVGNALQAAGIAGAGGVTGAANAQIGALQGIGNQVSALPMNLLMANALAGSQVNAANLGSGSGIDLSALGALNMAAGVQGGAGTY